LRVFARHGFISLRYAISLICSILSGATSKLLVSPFSIDCIISISIISSDLSLSWDLCQWLVLVTVMASVTYDYVIIMLKESILSSLPAVPPNEQLSAPKFSTTCVIPHFPPRLWAWQMRLAFFFPVYFVGDLREPVRSI
jgi:hypothetical protein